MRQIGTVESKQHAERFSNFLATRGVTTQVEENNGQWCIWVREEDQLTPSREELTRFAQNPDESKYVKAASEGLRIKQEEKRRLEKAARNTVEVRRMWNAPLTRRAPLTAALIAICVLIGLFSDSVFAPNQPEKFSHNVVFRSLSLYDPLNVVDPSWNGSPFVDIKRGQLWRLFTPALLHLGLGHIVFNMFALHFFGGRIESRQGWFPIAIMFFVGAAAGVLGEYFGGFLGEHLAGALGNSFRGGGNAVGFSGVGYCLFGYLWTFGKLAPERRLGIEPQNTILFFGWLIAGFAGLLERLFGMQVANWAHLFGLLAGIAIAAIAVWFDGRRRNMSSAKS